DGGSGADTLEVHGDADFSGSSLTSLERVHLTPNENEVSPTYTQASFLSAQLGAGLSTTALVTGSLLPDTLPVIASGASDPIDLSGLTFASWSSDDTVRIIGGSGANTLTGTGQNDSLEGGAGADTLIGAAGSDHLYASDAATADGAVDNMFGGTGDDV